jgi:hypothetical protein
LYIDDIEGVRARGLYKGIAKEILQKKDIDGASPKHEYVNLFISKPFIENIVEN